MLYVYGVPFFVVGLPLLLLAVVVNICVNIFFKCVGHVVSAFERLD